MNRLTAGIRSIGRRGWRFTQRGSLYSRTRAATVAICVRDANGVLRPFGSGVNIDPRGLVVTCKHVIEAAQVERDGAGRPPQFGPPAAGVTERDVAFHDLVAVNTFIKDGEMELGISRAHSIFGEHDVDLAIMLLRADEPLPFMQLNDSNRVDEGEHVFACGFPFGPRLQPGSPVAPLFQRGIIAGIRPHFLHAQRASLLLDMTINPGNSGGPLLSEASGGVVGIVSARIEIPAGQPGGIGFAVPSNRARALVRFARDDGSGRLEIQREALLGDD